MVFVSVYKVCNNLDFKTDSVFVFLTISDFWLLVFDACHPELVEGLLNADPSA
jgi:hypothetical protein